MDPFELFDTTDYTFLKLDSTSGGNVILEEFSANGIVKIRDGMIQVDNMEAYGSSTVGGTATIHIRADETFISEIESLIGNGVRFPVNGEDTDFRITGYVDGKDFDEGRIVFYKATLKRENIWDESGLPLE